MHVAWTLWRSSPRDDLGSYTIRHKKQTEREEMANEERCCAAQRQGVLSHAQGGRLSAFQGECERTGVPLGMGMLRTTQPEQSCDLSAQASTGRHG